MRSSSGVWSSSLRNERPRSRSPSSRRGRAGRSAPSEVREMLPPGVARLRDRRRWHPPGATRRRPSARSRWYSSIMASMSAAPAAIWRMRRSRKPVRARSSDAGWPRRSRTRARCMSGIDGAVAGVSTRGRAGPRRRRRAGRGCDPSRRRRCRARGGRPASPPLSRRASARIAASSSAVGGSSSMNAPVSRAEPTGRAPTTGSSSGA